MKTTLMLTGLTFFLLSLSFAQTKTVRQKASSVSLKSTSASISDGQKIYLQRCLTCHMVDGGGVPNMNPPLVKTSYVLGDKTRLIKVVLNGFAQNVDIDGQSYSNNMPPQSNLTDQEIADVLTYVRHSFTNRASVITKSEVKAVRSKK